MINSGEQIYKYNLMKILENNKKLAEIGEQEIHGKRKW